MIYNIKYVTYNVKHIIEKHLIYENNNSIYCSHKNSSHDKQQQINSFSLLANLFKLFYFKKLNLTLLNSTEYHSTPTVAE